METSAAEFLPRHPSAILRSRDHAEREDAFAGLVEDLAQVAGALTRASALR